MALLAATTVAIGFLTLVLSAVSEDVVAANGLERGDLTELQLVATHRSGPLVSLATLFSTAGSVPVLAIVAVFIGAYLWLRGQRLFVAATPLAALVTTGAIVAGAKHLVDRDRPPLGLRVIAETDASFPSGHSSNSAALLLTAAILIAVVALHGRWNRTLLVLLAGLAVATIGASRMILGVHYPTDVLAGWLLGAVVALAMTTATLLARHRTDVHTPDSPNPRPVRVRRFLLADRTTRCTTLMLRSTTTQPASRSRSPVKG